MKAAQEKKGEEICVLDLRDLSSFTDFFVILNGNSSRQNVALFESVEEELKKTGLRPLSVEGKENAEWILMDYGFFLVHVFTRNVQGLLLLGQALGRCSQDSILVLDFSSSESLFCMDHFAHGPEIRVAGTNPNA